MLVTHYYNYFLNSGDQKVERPKTSSYNLAKTYNFNQTLMERMINNGLPLNKLTKQFRMRPEIMSLVLPFITNKLENSENTCHLPKIIGITKNVFFIDHNIIEVNTNYIFCFIIHLTIIFEIIRNVTVKIIQIYMK